MVIVQEFYTPVRRSGLLGVVRVIFLDCVVSGPGQSCCVVRGDTPFFKYSPLSTQGYLLKDEGLVHWECYLQHSYSRISQNEQKTYK